MRTPRGTRGWPWEARGQDGRHGDAANETIEFGEFLAVMDKIRKGDAGAGDGIVSEVKKTQEMYKIEGAHGGERRRELVDRRGEHVLHLAEQQTLAHFQALGEQAAKWADAEAVEVARRQAAEETALANERVKEAYEDARLAHAERSSPRGHTALQAQAISR